MIDIESIRKIVMACIDPIVVAFNNSMSQYSASLQNLTSLINNVSQKAGNGILVCDAEGTSDAIIGSFTPPITTLEHNLRVTIRTNYSNMTKTPTFTPNNGVIPPYVIKKGNGKPLLINDILGSGAYADLIFDDINKNWILLNPVYFVSLWPGTVLSFVTFNDLRSASIDVTESLVVYVGGNSTIGDGGQGMFSWNASSTLPDDNSSVLCPIGHTSVGRWVRL